MFSLTVNGQTVNVEKYQDYHYAHFSFDGTVNLKITASNNIDTFTISPKSYSISGTKSGKDLAFSLTQDSTLPMYIVIQINDLEKLVILGDPLEVNPPPPSGTGIYNIKNSPYNADSTGSTDVTSILQQAINNASAAGGGTVYFPAGIYKVIKSLYLQSNVTLYLAGGAVIRSTTNRNEMISAEMTYTSGDENWIHPVLRMGSSKVNIAIKGRGVIDASGIALMDTNTLQYRRRALNLSLTEGLTLEGIIVKDATSWTVAVTDSQNISETNVKVLNHKNAALYKPENDGINICSSAHAIVDKCFVMTVDDAMCSKSTGSNETYDVTFSNNVVFSSCAGVKAGMQGHSHMYNIRFLNNNVLQARRGIVAENTTGTNVIEDIHFINTNIETLVTTIAGGSQPIYIEAKTGPVKNIHITGANYDNFGTVNSLIKGSSSSINADNVLLTDIYINGNLISNVTDGRITVGNYAAGINFLRTIVNESFNNYTIGSAPTGWTVTNASNTACTVEGVPDASNMSMRLYDNNSSGYTRSTKTFTASSGKIIAQWRFMEPTAGWWSKFQLMNGSTVATLMGISGTNLVYTNSSGSNVTIQSVSPNTWYTVKILADVNTDTYDIYVDNIKMISGATFRNGVSSISGIRCESGSGGTGTTYIDDVQVASTF